MKNYCYLITIAAVLFSYSLKAQNASDMELAPIFISVSGGFNHTGIIGFGVEYPIKDEIAIFADLGIGGWGLKAGLGASYYFKNIRKGPSVNVAYYFASGTGDQAVELSGDDGKVRMVVFNSVGTLNLTYGQNKKLGKRGKFALIGGYAFGIGKKENAYQYLDPTYSPTDLDRSVLKFIHPDGLILGFKFLFGIGG